MQFQKRYAFKLALAVILLSASGAQAFEGRYESRDETQTLVVKKLSPTNYKVTLAIGIEGRCSGNVVANATLSGPSLQSSRGVTDERPPREKPEMCKLTLTRTPNGMTVNEQSCSYFHGASCGFGGNYLKR